MNNTVQCGACAEKIEITGDGLADYKQFMQHLAVCPKRQEQEKICAQLVEEFERQQQQQYKGVREIPFERPAGFEHFPREATFTRMLACEKCGASWDASTDVYHVCEVPKSARGWLQPIPTLGALTPLHLVVCAALLVLIGWLIGVPK